MQGMRIANRVSRLPVVEIVGSLGDPLNSYNFVQPVRTASRPTTSSLLTLIP